MAVVLNVVGHTYHLSTQKAGKDDNNVGASRKIPESDIKKKKV